MRQRLYPETIPVLASYWLKTVYGAGHKLSWWKELHELLRQAARSETLYDIARAALTDVQAWIQQTVLLTRKPPESRSRELQPFRPGLTAERLPPYVGRLLNEWLPSEVARILTEEGEPIAGQEPGIPVLTVGVALERVLVREHLSPGTLEMLLQPGLLSPQYVYPADAEILRDVVSALLGRTWAMPFPVMPAAVLGVAAGSPLSADYRDAVRTAFLVQNEGRDEVHVPITAAQARAVLQNDRVRIGSSIVTMDGRWWASESLQSGDRREVVYRPGGRLRLDYTADHVKLAVPWLDTPNSWSGAVHFDERFQLFGREWRASSWETDGERTWLHLSFSRVLLPPEAPAEETRGRQSRPAFVDMAWAALQNALAAAVLRESTRPIEEMHHSDLIPLGRAIFELADVLKNGRAKGEAVETQLRAIRFMEAAVSLSYGRVPWVVLPAVMQGPFLKRRPEPAVVELLNQVFDELPPALISVSPSQAA